MARGGVVLSVSPGFIRRVSLSEDEGGIGFGTFIEYGPSLVMLYGCSLGQGFPFLRFVLIVERVLCCTKSSYILPEAILRVTFPMFLQKV